MTRSRARAVVAAGTTIDVADVVIPAARLVLTVNTALAVLVVMLTVSWDMLRALCTSERLLVMEM